MFKEDFKEFCQILDDVSELRQLPVLSANAKALFFRAVAHYSMAQFKHAVQAHLVDPEAGKYKTQLQPAHIVAQIEKHIQNDGRPDSDEAWAIALEASDEMMTVVWTDEIAQASAVASAVLATGDRTGARMAFKSSYARLVSKARKDGAPVKWIPSLGQDVGQREIALHQAAQRGLLSAPQINALLPAPDDSDDITDEERKANILRIKEMLATSVSASHKLSLQRSQQNEKERERLAKLKAESARKVEEVMESNKDIR